jgi:hypothetical protein
VRWINTQLDKYSEKYFSEEEGKQRLLQLEESARDLGIDIKKNETEYKTDFEFLDELTIKWNELSKPKNIKEWIYRLIDKIRHSKPIECVYNKPHKIK